MPSDTSKKRKRHSHESTTEKDIVDTSRPSAKFHPTGFPRTHTVSVALPGSFLNNAHSFELKTILCGQIARALAVFCVDEIVIFDDGVQDDTSRHIQRWQDQNNASTPANDLLALLLSYLETPPHMRRKLFPMNPDLQKAGLLPSLDMPHHLRRDEWCQYREGVTLDTGTSTSNAASSTMVDVGTGTMVNIPVKIPPNTRVTIKYSTDSPSGDMSYASAVAPSSPREESGWYWGYDVRQASSLADVFTECSLEGGYDVSIGTSERGRPVQELISLVHNMDTNSFNGSKLSNGAAKEHEKISALRNFSHMLLVFGGHQGLEIATKNDAELRKMGVGQPEELFDWWVNLCPGQGSRTIRTEEAIWLGLSAFQTIVADRSTRL